MKKPFGSKPPSCQMFQILLQDVHWSKINIHVLFLWKVHENTKVLENILEIISKKNPVWLKPPSRLSFLVPIHDVLSLHFMLIQAKANIGKYRKILENTPICYSARSHPPGFLLVPIPDLVSLHFIIVQAKTNTGNTGKYRKHIWKITEKRNSVGSKPPSRQNT